MLIDIVLIFIPDIHIKDGGGSLPCDDLSKSLEEFLKDNPELQFVCDGKRVKTKTELQNKFHKMVLKVSKRELCLQYVYSK